VERAFGSIRGASKIEFVESLTVPFDSGRRQTEESCA
jgi:hypothetical protein